MRRFFPPPRRVRQWLPVGVVGLALAWAALWPLPSLQAALTWQQTTVALTANAKSDVLEAKFHFTNDGKTPIDVEQVESSCGCTTAQLDKRHYEPGESGEIVAQYTVGEHVGKQTKTIAVQTSDTRDWKILMLDIDIPEILRVRPAFVYWKQGEAAKTKTITLEMMQDAPFKELTVQTSNAKLKPELKETVKGRRYELNVTPTQTDQFAYASLTILLRFNDKDTKTFRAYATVKAPEPGGE